MFFFLFFSNAAVVVFWELFVLYTKVCLFLRRKEDGRETFVGAITLSTVFPHFWVTVSSKRKGFFQSYKFLLRVFSYLQYTFLKYIFTRHRNTGVVGLRQKSAMCIDCSTERIYLYKCWLKCCINEIFEMKIWNIFH